MFAYIRPPIDSWPGWLTEKHFKEQLIREYGTEDAASALNEYADFFKQARGLAKRLGWEGDIRQGPYIAGLPAKESGGDRNYMIGRKQDNNGTTFIVSPFRIGWLENDEGEWIEG